MFANLKIFRRVAVVRLDPVLHRETMMVICIATAAVKVDRMGGQRSISLGVYNNLTDLGLLEGSDGRTIGVDAAVGRRVKSHGS